MSPLTKEIFYYSPATKEEVFYYSSNRSECHLRLKKYHEAMRDATLSIGATYSDSSVYIKTLYRRAKAFHELKRPFEALGKYGFPALYIHKGHNLWGGYRFHNFSW